MKKYFLALVIFCNIAVVYAADEECEAAVDAASRVNPDKDKRCDYSNTGLNGVLHRALAKKSESPESVASEEKKLDTKVQSSAQSSLNSAASNPINLTTKPVDTTKTLLATGEFTSAQQLQTLRYALIQKAAQECSKGFIVEGERYLPGAKGTTLEFIYHCL